VHLNGASIPASLSQAQLHAWMLSHPQQASLGFLGNPPQSPAADRSELSHQLSSFYGSYVAAQASRSTRRPLR
jgi:hypothetical protein